MIRVLHYIPAFDVGGIENLVMSIYDNIDREKVNFDFLVEKDIPKFYKDKIIKYGGNIYTLPKMTKRGNLIKYFKQLNKIFKTSNFDVFHCHSWETRPFPILFAKIYKVNLIVAHAHFIDFNDNNNLFIKKFFRFIGVKLSNFRIACTKEAGIANFSKDKFVILNNGVNVKNFVFNSKIRDKMRDKYNIKNDELILINVGRLTKLKNQIFLLKVLKEINDNKYKLFLIGSGPDRSMLTSFIKKNKLDEKVYIIEDIFDASNFLSMADIFVFPSISEGLGLAYVEAQINGLPCVVSSGIPQEVTLASNCGILDLDDVMEWSNFILNSGNERINYQGNYSIFEKYDIKVISQKYFQLLLENLK